MPPSVSFSKVDMKAVIADDFFTYLSISAFTHAVRSFDISKKTKQIFVKIR